MGCATSKEKVCQNCQAPFSPMARRSYSMHVHHLPQTEGDSHHLVSLSSTTLGSLRLDPMRANHYIKEELAPAEIVVAEKPEKWSKEDFAMGVIEAKTWSKMLEEKIPKVIPKTPTQTPPGEPETINAWELMADLEDTSRLGPPHLRSFSFHVPPKKNPSFYDDDEDPSTPSVKQDGDQGNKPKCVEMADSDSHLHSDDASLITEFDLEVICTFRKALEDLPPANPFHLKPVISDTRETLMNKNTESEEPDAKKLNETVEEYKSMALVKERLVLYFTSLRGVRKTFEDCCHVRVILKGLGVKIDERDVSMHSGFKEELKELLGEGHPGGGLPKVFIGAKYIGGAEEIRRMNESGQLEKLVERCEKLEDSRGGGGRTGGVCEGCGDIRFVPCDTCSGSCKIFYEGDYEEESEEDEYGFQRCPNCNENGLRRCPICCD